MFEKVLIANRGAIACRIIRTLERMGIDSVAVYSEADRHTMHVRAADEAVAIGPPPAAESYLNIDAILDAARQTGAEAIHPGYGFLSENPEFAEACERAGIVFIGPRPVHMRAFGLKHSARELALQPSVPLAPGSGLIRDVAHATSEAARIGYPVMIKSTAGGGGIGLQLVSTPDDIAPMYERVERLARNNFKDAGIFIEKYVARGRHIEVQIFGDGKGNVVALGERDCSAQRRNQKVIEETPAPNLPETTRAALWETARRLGQSVNYGAPAPSNISTTPRPTTSISSRSIRASRSSTASPRRSTASISSNGWCGRPPATWRRSTRRASSQRAPRSKCASMPKILGATSARAPAS